MEDNLEPPKEERVLEPLDNIVCDICFEKNLTEDIHIQSCVSCGDSYCVHNSSKVDPTHCIQCLKDISIDISIIRKTSIHSNHETGQTYIRSRKARQIKLGGQHWLFAQRRITDMNDEDLLLAIEYHRGMYDSLIYEREKRRAENFHRNANKVFKVPTSATGTILSSSTVKKTKTIKAAQPAVTETNTASLFEALLKQGFTKEQLIAMAMGKVKK
jgi:hypothetical protein